MMQSNNSRDMTIRVGWLIDGRGGALQQDRVMRLNGGRIAAIDPWQPGQSISKDFSNATVLPPLMDAHVHLAFSGTSDARERKSQLSQTTAQARSAVVRHLEKHWKCGVAAVRDAGDPNGDVLWCKQQNVLGSPVHVAATCWAWHAEGRYGKMIGRPLSRGLPPEIAIQAHLSGVDHLKVIQSGLNSIDRFGYQGAPQFSADDLCRMAAVAHDAGLPVMVHANGEIAVGLAVDARCDTIEHGYFMGEDNLERLAQQAIFWVPTVIPMAALAEAENLTSSQRDVARRTVDHQLAQIAKAHQWGVTIALGTDAGSQGVDHGTAVRRELRLLMSAGLSLEEAVGCATANVARLMGFHGRGELMPGAMADFIVVPGAPSKILEERVENSAVCIGGLFYNIER